MCDRALLDLPKPKWTARSENRPLGLRRCQEIKR